MRKLFVILRAGIWALAFVVPGIEGRTDEPSVTPPPEAWPEVREATFKMVWQTVNESYFDPTFGGVDWAAVGEKYRQHLPEATDKKIFRDLLQAMLGELRRSHFSIQPRELSVFTPAERSRVGTAGLELAVVEDGVVVAGVEPNSPAATAGLRPGDVVLQVGEQELAPLQAWLEQSDLLPARRGFYLEQMVAGRLQGAVGASARLRVRSPQGGERSVEMTLAAHEGEWSEPMGDFPSMPIVVHSRCEADGVAYLRFNVFARAAMKEIRGLLRRVPPDGGLVIDLRGNPGGLGVMASGISGWLSDRSFPLGTMHMRQGHIGFTVAPQTGAFLGPVAILIDSGSASTSEIMAAGLQEAGRVRVFGVNSPGAALPSLFKALPTGDLLQHAIADMQTPRGVTIEGRGVVPDEVVHRTAADLAAGCDPVLAAARRWLESVRDKAARPAANPAETSPSP